MPQPLFSIAAPPFIDERLPAEWTSAAPQAMERVPKPASDWIARAIALAVLAFFAVFGFQAMTWALGGGWQWLWMLVGLPVFAAFSVATVRFVLTTLRERRRVRVALANISLERGEGFRPGTPLDLRLRATVPAAQEGERTMAPEHIAVRLMRRLVRRAPDGSDLLVDECHGEALARRDDARAHRLVYTCTLGADPDEDGTAQWFVTLHDTAVSKDDAPFLIAGLRLLR